MIENNTGAEFKQPQTNREWQLLEKLVMEGAQEQRRARRWGLVFKLGILVYMFVALMMFSPSVWQTSDASPGEPHVALIDVKGVIMATELANADALAGALREAFEAEKATSIILRINSPGGSPVQAGMIYREILRLREEHPDKKVYAVITDVGASGAYYIAAAAEEIYADPASMVGSIGVVSDGFGFTGTMEKLGVERRVFTAGDNKAMLDPFSPLQSDQKAFFEKLLVNVHQQFITAVKEGRGGRLKDNPDIFSGLVWSGEQALELGVVDGLASPGEVARDKIGLDNIVDYSPKGSPFQDLFRGFGVSLGKGAMLALKEMGWQLK